MSFYLIANALGNMLPPSHTGVWLLVRVYIRLRSEVQYIKLSTHSLNVFNRLWRAVH